MQRSLHSFFPGTREHVDEDDDVEVWDLFCGAGGFSCGARNAGKRVAFACDADDEAMRVHELNHPNTVHSVCSLPCDIPFPTDGTRYHVHGSPPCQRFSTASGQVGNSEMRVSESENMVKWYLELALTSGATSWSMEQVAAARVISILNAKKRSYPSALDYEIFDLSALGVPQSRRRVIAGTPRLISKLRRQCMTKRPNRVCDFILDCKGTHIRHAKNWKRSTRRDDGSIEYEKATWTDLLTPITAPSPTIVASRVLSWVSTDGKTVGHCTLSTDDAAALQTFPRSYHFPTKKHKALRMIGNAVPPFVAELMFCKEDARRANSDAVVLKKEQPCKTVRRIVADPLSPSHDWTSDPSRYVP